MSYPLAQVIEAIIFASPNPISKSMICHLLENESPKQIEATLVKLVEKYNSGKTPYGFILAQVAEGYQFRTRIEFKDTVAQLYAKRPRSLGQSTLEVLSIVAYKQPVTKSEIEKIKGTETQNMLKSLISKNLISIMGKKDDVGKPNLYGTTRFFLEFFGLSRLTDLPSLTDFSGADITPTHLADIDQELGLTFSEETSRPTDEDSETLTFTQQALADLHIHKQETQKQE